MFKLALAAARRACSSCSSSSTTSSNIAWAAAGRSARRCFADNAGKGSQHPPKGLLGTYAEEFGSTNFSRGTNGGGRATQARMQQLREEAVAKAEASATKAAPSTGQRIASALIDLTLVGGVVCAAVGGYYYLYDTKELEHILEETKAKPENQFTGSALWIAFMERYLDWRRPLERKVREYTDPTCEQLLPDLAPEHKALRIKTLVLDLEDVLVHREWTRAKGWQILKRPGAQDFLFQVGQYFEVVVYTDEPSLYAEPIIIRLDTYHVVQFRLYRQETQYHEGKHVRDLSKLNRDLSQVLFVSSNPDAYAFQPENTLKLKPWTGDTHDTALLDLIPFLQMIATRGVLDTRDVVKSYDGEPDIARAFKARMQQMVQTKEQRKPRRFGFGSVVQSEAAAARP